MTRSTRFFHALGLAAVISTGGCAVAPSAPPVELDRAEAAVQRARAAGVEQWAPADLDAAVLRLRNARLAQEAGEEAQARRQAQQVELDVELAMARAESARARREVQEKSSENAELRRELLGEGDDR